jgi:hypothetical protein
MEKMGIMRTSQSTRGQRNAETRWNWSGEKKAKRAWTNSNIFVRNHVFWIVCYLTQNDKPCMQSLLWQHYHVATTFPFQMYGFERIEWTFSKSKLNIRIRFKIPVHKINRSIGILIILQGGNISQ